MDFARENGPAENDHRLDYGAALDFVLDIRVLMPAVVHVSVSLELNRSVVGKKNFFLIKNILLLDVAIDTHFIFVKE